MSEFFVHASQMDELLVKGQPAQADPAECKETATSRLVIDVRLVIDADSSADLATTPEQLVPVVVDLTTGTARASTDRDLAELPMKAAEIGDLSKKRG